MCPTILEKDSLKAHMRLHKEIDLFTCEVCGKKFQVKKYLSIHIKILEKTSFPCEICESMILPRFIRQKQGHVNTMVRLDQEGEHLHQVFNTLERVYKAIASKPLRYFHMLEAYENKLYCTK